MRNSSSSQGFGELRLRRPLSKPAWSPSRELLAPRRPWRPLKALVGKQTRLNSLLPPLPSPHARFCFVL
jgi:hypothetical protein